MKTKIDIFSGFLGAGKTTLIKKLIDEQCYTDQIVIIENEFGEVGIDGSILKKNNLQVKEINAGCICCTVAGDFKKAIEEAVKEYQPDRILIEPSGVGKLSEVLQVCKSAVLKEIVSVNTVMTVVDVLKYEMYSKNFGEFYKNQIQYAKTILLSRTQKTSEEKVEKTVEMIRTINPKAIIITTPWDLLKGQRIMEVGEDESESLSDRVKIGRMTLSQKHKSLQIEKSVHHHADQVFETWGVETSKHIPKQKLESILTQLGSEATYGTVLRAKGIVQTDEQQWIQFDYVPKEQQMSSIEPDYTGRICVIGSHLQKEAIKALFLE